MVEEEKETHQLVFLAITTFLSMTVHCSLLALRGIAQHCIQKIIFYSESCIVH